MDEVREKLNVSERRACRVLGQPRSTQRRQPYVPDDEPRLVADMVMFASEYGRYGYRRITALLQREGWRVNHKRVERLWRREGLKCPKNSRNPGDYGSMTDRVSVFVRRTGITCGPMISYTRERTMVGLCGC